MQMRDGKMTKEDIDFIYTKIVNNKTKLLEDLRYASYFNRDQDAINTALFEEWCKLLYNERGHTNDTIIILADNVEVKSSSGSYELQTLCNNTFFGSGISVW